MRRDAANRPWRTKSSTWFLRGTKRRGELQSKRRREAVRPALEALEPRTLLASDLLIAEFVAVNQAGLQDEDGDRSDWLEVFNNGAETVNLNGWHLTDDPTQLTKWEFPSVQLAPGRGVVVFASDKDRDTAGRELHTNFQLSSAGEYLALVSPDGSTVVDQFNPYPPQLPDVSYGREQTQTSTTLVTATSPSRRLLPSSSATDLPASTWTATSFNDSTWTQSPAAIGYDQIAQDGDFGPLIAPGGQLTTMPGVTSSAYLRTHFQVDTSTPFNRLDLNMNFDDGAVAYLNGTEVIRVNANNPLAWNSTASAENGVVAGTAHYLNFTDADARADFNLVGAAQWQNGRLQLTPALADQTGAAWLREPLVFGPDYSFSASMVINVHSPGGTSDRDGRGGHGMTFVLQSGGENALGGPAGQLGLDATGMSFVAVEFDTFDTGSFDPDSTLGSHVGINTSGQGNVARAAVPRFNGDAAVAGQPGAGVDLRYVWIEYEGQAEQLQVYFSSTAQRPAAPTLVAQVDFASVFGGVTQLWTGWTAATGSAYNAHDVRSFELTAEAGQLGLTARTFSLANQQHLLRNGDNVLAIHGLNVAVNDHDFLIRPELTGTSQTLGAAKYFTQPTPGQVNGVGDEAPAGSVTFSHETRTFVDAFDLVLTPPNSNAVIRYTTNGTIPSASSTLYSGPIRITTTTRIRARAFETGQSPGPVRSEGYIALDSSVANFEQGQAFNSNLPLMIFESYGKNVESQNASMVPVSGVFINPGADGRASILDVPEFGGRGGMRIRGQTSEGFAKKQFSLELWSELNDDSRNWLAGQVEDEAASFFGLPSESDWVINGPYSDKTQLNNYLTFLWSNNADLYAPRARLVEVFLNQNGGKVSYPSDYRGTYVLLEKIKRDADRVDIERLTPEDNSLPEISGGYIWKKDKAGAGDVPFSTSRGQELRMVEPDDNDITPQQKNWLRNHINEFEAALYGSNFTDPEVGYAKYIDVDSWATTWLLVEMTKNIDGFRLSTYYHKDRDGKITQGPAWDYNLSLANGNYLRGAYPEGWYGTQLSQGDYPYWSRLFEDPNFKQRVADKWNELRNTVWSTENLLADIQHAVSQLSDGNPRLESPAAGEPSNPISRNFDKWGTLNSYLWPNCFFGQGDCPASPLPNGRRPARYGDYIFILEDFIQRRTAWMDSQFPLGPQLNPSGGVVTAGTQVTIEVPGGWTAYYTLDGTDPRRPVTVSREDVLLPAQSAGQVLVPQNSQLINLCNGLSLPNPASCFISPNYVPGANGESWISGSLGVGFDEQTDYLPYINTNVGARMNDQSTSVYVRVPFEVTAAQKNALTNLTLRMRYDDGFVAYIWSDSLNAAVEIARANAPGSSRAVPIIPLAYNAAATSIHDDGQAVVFSSFDVSNAAKYLRTGTNYLVIQGLNESLSSSDFLIDAEIVGASIGIDLPEGVLEYTGPITIDRNLQLNARLLNDAGSAWSGLTSQFYVTASPQLMITEINYHPALPTAAELAQTPSLDKNDFEFIEIRNVGGTAADLAGFQFSAGIGFTFPTLSLAAGEYGVVVKNEAAFRLRYGDTPRVLGQFASGTLDNAGERLELVDSASRTVVTVTYDDSGLWPQAADGTGATLELVDQMNTPIEQLGKYYRWQSSAELHGSPGRVGLARIPVVINEVLANSSAATGGSDAIELLNIGTTAIDIGGWYVSDSQQNLFKYRIPNGTTLPAGGYLVLTESHFNPNPSAPSPHHFALSGSEGDDVWVTVAAAQGGIAMFVDDVHFGPTRNGEALGRIPNGGGFLTPLVQPTLGSTNQNPRFGTVLISEVMYHSSSPSAAALAIDPTIAETELEFIEISNPTGAAVALTNWRIRGGVDFDFPAATQLLSGESLLVLPFDPLSPLNATRLAAFKAHYSLGPSVKLVGGYVGRMNNDGERISLQRPEAALPGEPNIIPRVIEDEMVYDDLTPWPTTADGTGASLQRVSTTTFGNAATSWRGAAPSPGTFVSDGRLPGDFNGDGRTDGADMEMLCLALQQGNSNSTYDLNNDGLVNDQDRDMMVLGILGTNYGDANLDGIFNSTDLIHIFQFGEYEDRVVGNSTWNTGDFNCDGEFDSGDLVLAFQGGAYVAAARPVARVTTVPVSAPISAATISAALESDEFAGAPANETIVPPTSSTGTAGQMTTKRIPTAPAPRTSLFAVARDEYFAELANQPANEEHWINLTRSIGERSEKLYRGI